jgi:hypothetical protein
VPEQTKQQLEQPRLRGLVGQANTVRLAQGGQQAGNLWPGRAGQVADLCRADLCE